MQEINIEWRHYDKEGETCTRCNNTGDNIQKAIKEISADPSFDDTEITFRETKLKADKMSESNTVLINGITIESILDGSVSENYCHSCSCLAGKGSNCRTIEVKGKSYEAIPKEIVMKAIAETIKKD